MSKVSRLHPKLPGSALGSEPMSAYWPTVVLQRPHLLCDWHYRYKVSSFNMVRNTFKCPLSIVWKVWWSRMFCSVQCYWARPPMCYRSMQRVLTQSNISVASRARSCSVPVMWAPCWFWPSLCPDPGSMLWTWRWSLTNWPWTTAPAHCSGSPS